MSDKTVIGLSRLISLQQRVDKLARNIANQTTAGFKAEGLKFQEYLTEAREADGIPSSPMRSLVAVTDFTDFSAGSLKATGNPMDVAIVGNEFFVVKTTAGERFTRNGSFTLDNEGHLITLAGETVLTATGPLQVPRQDGAVNIAADGTISTKSGPVGRLRIVRFDDQTKLSAQGGTLFASQATPVEVPAAQVRLATGVLENSNVNTVREMSNLVAAARAYDQAAATFLRDDDKNELKRLSGEDQPRER
jgi:flagellar basal-body rod protein FlgF